MAQVISSAATPAFLWKVDGLAVSAALSPAVLAELRVSQNATPDTEFGGILVGSVEADGDGFRTQVDGFIPFSIEHRYGATYVLSPHDRILLERRMKRLRRRGLIPVGLCRSHRRRGLYMDQKDFELFREEFRHPASIFLLVRQVEGEAAPTGAIFVWEEEDVRRHASYLEFSLGEPSADEASVRLSPGHSREAGRPGLSWPAVARGYLVAAGSAAGALRNSALQNFARRRHSLSPAIAAQALITIALPLLAFYTARGIAEHRTSRPDVEPIRSAPEPIQRPGQPVDRDVASVPAAAQQPPAVTPSSSTPTQVAVAEPPDLPALTAAPNSRDRSATAMAPLPTPASSVPSDGRRPSPVGAPITPVLPEAPPVAQKQPVSSLPRLANWPPAPVSPSTVRPTEKVIAYFKPAPASSMRHGIQKVPLLRELTRHGSDDPADGYVPPNPIEHPLPSLGGKASRLQDGTSVQMLARVDRNGNVVNVKVVEGNHQLTQASADALLRWRFEPARQNGSPVEGGMLVRFEFHSASR